jgi:SRSO17 transposase
VKGQLSDLPRKNCEPIAIRAGVDPRALQKFMGEQKWDGALMQKHVYEIVARDHMGKQSIGVLDETTIVKKGKKTPGVKRQYCGASGKTDNCTATVHLGIANGVFHALVNSALYLPEDWAADRVRCREAGIPEELAYRSKWKIGLELHQEAQDNGICPEWLTADEYYGRPVEFHLELSRREQKYVLEVPCNFWGWLRKPKVIQGKRGPYLGGGSHISTVENLARFSGLFVMQEWTQFRIKDSTKGPVVWEAKSAPIHLKSADGTPTIAHWLIVARNVLNHDEIKYFVSNAPQDTPLLKLLCVAFSRWHIERIFEDAKTELGMDHFEVRNYKAMMRHLLLTAVSGLFLSRLHLQLKKKSGTDVLHGADSRECVPDIKEHAG